MDNLLRLRQWLYSLFGRSGKDIDELLMAIEDWAQTWGVTPEKALWLCAVHGLGELSPREATKVVRRAIQIGEKGLQRASRDLRE